MCPLPFILRAPGAYTAPIWTWAMASLLTVCFCVSFLSWYSLKTQRKASRSNSNLTAKVWPVGDTLVTVKVQPGEKFMYFPTRGTLRKIVASSISSFCSGCWEQANHFLHRKLARRRIFVHSVSVATFLGLKMFQISFLKYVHII